MPSDLDRDRSPGRRALGHLGEVVDELLAQAGVDEEELVRELGPVRRSPQKRP
jgi:hypothetical protein